MSQANLNMVTYEDILAALACDGSNVTMMVQGEPGCGKTSLGQAVADMKGYPFAYIDMANMAMGDSGLPVADHELHCARFYPNELYKLHVGGPVVIMLDEWTKALREAKNMTLPLCLPPRRIGDIVLHPDSIVFATGNMTGDGVGDSIQAHQRDRFVPVNMRKPTSKEWITNFAVPNNIDATVIMLAKEFPKLFESYLDDPEGTNKFIFNPRKTQLSYVSPRGLAKASDLVKTRHLKSEAMFRSQLFGAIGEAAGDLMAMVSLDEELPDIAQIVAQPKHMTMPERPINRLMLTYKLGVHAEKENLGAMLTYMERMPNEMLGIFMNKIMSTPSKNKWAASNKEMNAACSKYAHLF